METVVRSHPWEKAGLGVAPFRFVMMTTAPGQGDGCHYCGTGIKYLFHCVSSDGKRFHVGCDCIARCHLPAETIVTQAKRALKEHKTRVRREGEAARRKAEREARQAQWAAERETIKARLATDPLYLRLKAVVGEATRDSDANAFLVDMRDNMERWGHLTERQEAAAVRVLERIENGPALAAVSQWLGEVGDRVAFTATVEFTRCIYEGDGSIYDPARYLNKMRTAEGNVIAWFGAKCFREGATLTGTARISKRDEFRGEKQTTIKNPRWKK